MVSYLRGDVNQEGEKLNTDKLGRRKIEYKTFQRKLESYTNYPSPW